MHIPFKDETILLKGARVFELEQVDRLLQQKVHQTVLEIDLTAVAHNLKQFQQLLTSGHADDGHGKGVFVWQRQL